MALILIGLIINWWLAVAGGVLALLFGFAWIREVTRDVLPVKSHFTLTTLPAGLQLTLDGQPVTTPRTVTGVVGIQRGLGAPDQVSGGRRYVFDRWSDSGAVTHTISTPSSDTTYTATFADAGPEVDRPPTA